MFRRLLLLLILVAGLFMSQASGAAIAGLSYLDANGDGKYDTQFDSPLPGWDIRLFAQDGVLIATTKTDRNGFFVFDELPPGGTYLVEEVRPRGWVGIGGAISTVVLSSETPTEDSFHIDDDAGLRVRIPEEYLVFSTGSHVGGIGPCSLVSNARFGPVGASGGEDPAVCAAWRNGDVVPFSLGYDPATGKVTYMVGGRTSTWEVPESNREPIMHLALHTQADAPGTRVDLFGLRMAAEGMPGVSLPDTEIGGENTAIGRGTRGHDVLYLDMDAEKFFGKNIGATSFVLTGYQRIVWDPVHPPSSQTFGFVIEAGARTFPETDIRYAKFDGTAKDTKSAPVVSELAAPEPTTTVKAKETVEPTTVKTTETPEPTKTVKGTETPESTTTVKAKETAEPTTVKTTETPEPTKTVKGTETPEPTTTVKAKETAEPTTVETTETPEPTKTVKGTDTVSRGVAGSSPGTGTGSISGSKWHDLDGDHKWDSGEPTLSGWTIYLEMQEENGSNWLPMGSASTDSSGRYSFSGLAEGHYRVFEESRSGWEQTFPTNNAGKDEGKGSGIHNLVISNGQPSWTGQNFGNLGLTTATPTTTATTVAPTVTETTVEPTATITEGQPPTGTVTPEPTTPAGTGSISGSKWHDLDGDHKWDSGEPTLSGWTIYLEMQEENGSNWLPMGSASTDSSGRYSFSGLAEGHYRVFEESRSGWEQTFPTNNAGKDEGKGSGIHNLVISNGQPSWTGQDFGNLGLTTATPTTTATTVEPTVSETTVEPTVTETTVEPTVSETTVEPTVTETTVEPTVSETTVEPTVTETTVEPTGTITEGQPPTGTVTPEPTTPAGTGSISGSKWHDLDGDHKWDSGEPTLSGWTIYLEMQEENGSNWLPIGSVLTDANGRYSFTGLAEGHYRVYEVVPSGWEQTFPTNNAGMHNLVISNGQPSWDDRDFGNLGLASPTATITEGQTPTGTMTPTPEPTTPTRTGMITVIKFNDLNGNGFQDGGEPGIEGWLMTLYHDAVPIAVQATGSGGSTVFNNLDSAGEFLVTEETRDGWSPTTPALAHVNFSTSMEVTVRIGNWIPPTTVPTATETTVEPTVTVTTVEPTVTETTVVTTVTETTVEPTITDVRPPTATETTVVPTETGTQVGTMTPEPTITEGQPPTVTETTAVPTETGTQVGTMTPEPTITEGQPPTVTETTVVPTETGTQVGTMTPEPTITEGQPPTVTETTVVPTETGTQVGTMTPEPTITEGQPPTVTETTAVPTETGTQVGTMTPEPTITEGQPPTTTSTTSPAPTGVTTPGQTGTPGPTPSVTEGLPQTGATTPTPAGTTAGTTAPTTVPGTLQPTLTPTGTSPVPTDQGPQPTRTGVPTIRTQEPTATPTPWPTGTFVLPTPPIDMPTPVSGLCPAPQGSTGDETLITGPTRITSPGFYRFADSFVDVNETVWLEVVASNVTIDGNGHTLDGRDGFGTHGIRVMNGETVDRLFVQNLTVTDFAYGISLYNTTNSTIVFVNASSNTYDGIMTSGGADNLIACNVIHQDDDGINLTGTDRTVVINNTVTENFRGSGIHLAGGADGVRLLANRIGYNDEGIEVEETANSEIAQNLIWESRFYGLNLTSAENLTVFDNYVRNRQNIRPPTGPFTATWNLSAATGPNLFGGSTIGGNFWGDLNRTGFSETHLDNDRDGFVDVPYVLPDGAGIDWRPLAPPVNGVDRAMIGTANSWREWLMTFLT